MVIKSMGVVSLAKLMGLLYAALGFLIGALFALFSLLGGGALLAAGGDEAGLGMGMMAGLGLFAIVLFPVFYGVLGFVSGLICAFLFNLTAKFTGGLEIEVQ
ncbi:MAG: hypothetical protein WC213_11040 [Arenimonas sp.]|jgi:hypothetical protein